MQVVAVGDQGIENVVANSRQVHVKMILQLRHFHCVARAAIEKCVQHFEFVRPRGLPLGGRLLEMKSVFLVVKQAHHLVVFGLLDDVIAFHREINDGGGDIAHVRGIIDERADFAGRELIGRLVLHRDRLAARISAARPPQPEHDAKRKEGQNQNPIAAQVEKK